jgi:hypothetical protein
MMDAGINNVIYMELYSGPKMANGICGKTIDTGTIDRGSTVLEYKEHPHEVWHIPPGTPCIKQISRCFLLCRQMQVFKNVNNKTLTKQ